MQRFYPEERVEVELHLLGEDWVAEEPKLLRTFDTVPEAVAWAVAWFKGRGVHFICDVERHQRENHSYVVLHATDGMWIGTGQPAWRDDEGMFHKWPC